MQKKFEGKYANDKKYCRVRDYCHYTGKHREAAHSVFNLKYSIPKEVLVTFHNESNYDDTFFS